jgi:hypothetical protein
MKGIVIATITFIAAYTYVNLHYRKPGRPFEPYRDAQERARLAGAGFERITARAVRSASLRLPAAPVAAQGIPGGLPADLAGGLLDKPLLPAAIGEVSGPAAADASEPASVQFVCTLGDDRQQLTGAKLYVKEGSLFIVPAFERLAPGLVARSRRDVVMVTVPAGSLRPGRYQVTVVGADQSRRWSMQVH